MTFVLPVTVRQGVEVVADTAHIAFDIRTQYICPFCVFSVTATANQLRFFTRWCFDECGVLIVQIDIVLRAHVTAAAPALITDAEIGDIPGFFTAVFTALIGQCGVFVGGHVFDPLRHLTHAAAAQIAVDVGICAQQFNEIEDFVGAYCVGFFHTAPVGIYFNRAFIWIADAVAPVVFVSKAAAGPAHQRYFYCS